MRIRIFFSAGCGTEYPQNRTAGFGLIACLSAFPIVWVSPSKRKAPLERSFGLSKVIDTCWIHRKSGFLNEPFKILRPEN
jgi:hypothetical protein